MIPVESSHNRAIGPGCIGSSVNIPQRDPVYAPKQKKAQMPTPGAKSSGVCNGPIGSSGGSPHKNTVCPLSSVAVNCLTACQSTDMTWHTLSRYPYVTGASVLAVKYKEGADRLRYARCDSHLLHHVVPFTRRCVCTHTRHIRALMTENLILILNRLAVVATLESVLQQCATMC